MISTFGQSLKPSIDSKPFNINSILINYYNAKKKTKTKKPLTKCVISEENNK